jgi:hypothetical protein
VEAHLRNTIPPVGMWDGVSTCENGERCVGIILSKNHALRHLIGGSGIRI